MPTKFEQERDAARLARHRKVAQQIKETDLQMSRDASRTLLLYAADIVPDPDQPRRLYGEDETSLRALADSIAAVGLLAPIQVRPDHDVPGRYRIIVGERRWRACQLAGVNRIEAVVREDWDEFQVRAAQYEENDKREDVSDIARARSLLAMRQAPAGGGKRRGWEEVAERVGLQRNQAMRLTGLLQLPAPVIELIDRRFLPGTHGSELTRLLKRVPEAEILALAQSSCASVPGGKARRPVKELSRMITERLQADFDTEGTPEEEAATTALMATQQQQRPPGEPIPTLRGQAAVVPPVEEADVAEHSSAAAQQSATTGEDGGAEAEREPAPDRQAPRPFVVEFAQAWKAGALIPAERRMIYEMLEQYPLEREAA